MRFTSKRSLQEEQRTKITGALFKSVPSLLFVKNNPYKNNSDIKLCRIQTLAEI